jgi:hypothetical protein
MRAFLWAQVVVFLAAVAILVAWLGPAEWTGLLPMAPFLLGSVVGLVLNKRAMRHLSPDGQREPWPVLWRGSLAKRTSFTEEGWRLRLRSLWAVALGWLASGAWLIATR